MGVGEGLLLGDERRLRDLGFAIPGFSIAELISYLRLVDDGSIGSFVYCVQCLCLCATIESMMGSITQHLEPKLQQLVLQMVRPVMKLIEFNLKLKQVAH